jgi:hypothetical protein
VQPGLQHALFDIMLLHVTLGTCKAQVRQDSLQGAHYFVSQTADWLHKYDTQLSIVTSDLNGYCGRVKCDETVPAAVKALDTLQSDTHAIWKALEDRKAALCPAAACLNLDLLWFLKEGGCVCDAGAIARVARDADAGAP